MFKKTAEIVCFQIYLPLLYYMEKHSFISSLQLFFSVVSSDGAASVMAMAGGLIENTHKAYKFCAVCSSKMGLVLVQVSLT